MEEKPKSNVLRTLLIILGVIVGCCVLCWASSLLFPTLLMPVLSPLIEQQAEILGPVMMATLVESGGEVQFSGDLGTDFFAPFETITPTYTRAPTNTPTVFEPTATATQSLPASASCVPPGERVRALVTKVLAGDTIQVVIREQTFMVKYIGIHSPLLGIESEPYAVESAYTNRSLVENQAVTLMRDTSEVDTDGASLLRYVFVNDVFVNDEMLRLGMAQVEPLSPDTACEAQFLQSQQFAEEQRLGFWKEGGPAQAPSAPVGGTPSVTQQPTPISAQPNCDCKGPDLQCDDFSTRADAQACFDSCKAQGFGDKFLMDTNQNDIACEGKTP